MHKLQAELLAILYNVLEVPASTPVAQLSETWQDQLA